MRRLAPWLVGIAAILLLPTAAVAEDSSGSGDQASGPASGTITLCPGFPVLPSEKLMNEGIALTRGDVCHVYAGTIAGVVRGTQDTASFPDTSRIAFGTEQLVGTVAGRRGTAELSYSVTRACFPACSATVKLTVTGGSGALRGLQLQITAVGASTLSYTGSYALRDDTNEEGGNR